MRIRVISSREELEEVEVEETIVHTSFRPSEKDIFILVERCPNLKAIQMSPSFNRVLSETTRMFLSLWNIEVIEGDLWGHRKDLMDHVQIEDEVVDKVRQLADKGRAPSEIVERIGEEKKISEGLVKVITDSEKTIM